jgi:hypothetical protein
VVYELTNSQARVFISCGQQKESEEIEVAGKIADGLKRGGFDPYIAVAEQTLKGVKENIFRRLSESEYLIFIDFKRERLGKYEQGSFQDTGKHRGSLFSNQELAIATFLDIESLCFREEGVKEEDGILKFIQANSIPFRERDSLSNLVAQTVADRKWDPNWRNQIILERDTNEHEDVHIGTQTGPMARYYHIDVRNLHRDKVAFECAAYIQQIRNLTTETNIPTELVELKWKGLKIERTAIPPRQSQYLDVFFVLHDNPDVANLSINQFLIDYTGFFPPYRLIGPADYELTYTIFSYDMPSTKAKFNLHLGTTLNEVRFSRAD